MGFKLPTEADEQKTVCEWLRMQRILFCHVPNGGKRSKVEAAIFKGMGVQEGVPDLFIFTPVPIKPNARGVALEMKRQFGGSTTDNQERWLTDLAAIGWVTAVHHGANAAIDWLESLGYGG